MQMKVSLFWCKYCYYYYFHHYRQNKKAGKKESIWCSYHQVNGILRVRKDISASVDANFELPPIVGRVAWTISTVLCCRFVWFVSIFSHSFTLFCSLKLLAQGCQLKGKIYTQSKRCTNGRKGKRTSERSMPTVCLIRSISTSNCKWKEEIVC